MKEESSTCIICKQMFFGACDKSKYCGKACREIANNSRMNANWLKDKKKIRPDNDRIEYARVSKKPVAWMRKFNACRG